MCVYIGYRVLVSYLVKGCRSFLGSFRGGNNNIDDSSDDEKPENRMNAVKWATRDGQVVLVALCVCVVRDGGVEAPLL